MTRGEAKKPITRMVCRYAIHVEDADGCDLIRTMSIMEVFRMCGGADDGRYTSCPEYLLRSAGTDGRMHTRLWNATELGRP